MRTYGTMGGLAGLRKLERCMCDQECDNLMMC